VRRSTFLVFALAAILGIAVTTGAAGDGSYGVRNCSQGNPLCAETADSIGLNGSYTGHDEPSLLFYSNTAGSGNSSSYRIQLPTDPKPMPTQDGKGSTWNFQLHPAFWVGMALCDSQSAPEFTHAPCTPDSDTNIFDGTNPSGADYIGKHPGAAFLELQFYPPGWGPLPLATSCDPTKWCTAMAIFSLLEDLNTGTFNNADCLNQAGPEPANYAFLTLSGLPHASPNPLTTFAPPYAASTPNPATDLFMNSGDVLSVDIHDTPSGLVTVVHDVTTGQTGSMTASAANGFAQENFQPTAATCSTTPYTFHPMYSTASEHTRVPWAAHTYNIAFSDEIGHFEYCKQNDEEGGECTSNGESSFDDDDVNCFSKNFSLKARIGGCLGSDADYDGPSYLADWPGSGGGGPGPGKDDKNNPSSILFTSPLFNGTQNYDRVAFEADMPRIEAPDSGGICNRFTGENCTNPPPGAAFYPIYTTGKAKPDFFNTPGKPGPGNPPGPPPKNACIWQFGGTGLKDTTNTFGGDSTAEYGSLLFSFYASPNPAIRLRANNFRQVLDSNPCPAPTG
jgi:hypothetical protein